MYVGSSSQEDNDSSDTDDEDRRLASSAENIASAPEEDEEDDSSEEEDDDESDDGDNATALGGRTADRPTFQPQPNAFERIVPSRYRNRYFYNCNILRSIPCHTCSLEM